jgi:hypothetical protein
VFFGSDSVVEIVLVVVVIVTFGGGLAVFYAEAVWGRAHVSPETGAIHIRYGPFQRFFTYVAVGIILVGQGLSWLRPIPKEQSLAEARRERLPDTLFGIVSSAFLLWGVNRRSLVITDEGLDCRSPWGRRRFVPWGDVTAISYSRNLSRFLVETKDGWKFRLSRMLPGLDRFLAECERHLPADALTPASDGYRSLKRPFPPPITVQSPALTSPPAK